MNSIDPQGDKRHGAVIKPPVQLLWLGAMLQYCNTAGTNTPEHEELQSWCSRYSITVYSSPHSTSLVRHQTFS